ncbi:MAG: phosphatase PAP2 family protein [Gordonia sp. (in: high G+C Gram-positive bacteria)]|uniref:phosphatase PAP2 family protein n=1 Tax=Gordonia sp. (in: high G+C Gram-positive bacteria) TaxID=84139 RepID=UPI0039E37C7A
MSSRSRRSRIVAGASLLALVALGAVFFAVRPAPTPFDRATTERLVAVRGETLNAFAVHASFLFSPVVAVGTTAAAACALVLRDRSPYRALPVAATSAVAAGAAAVFKVAVARPRPPEHLQVGPPEGTYSYPSGHVTGTAALVAVLLVVVVADRPRGQALAAYTLGAGAVLLCAWTRIYLGMHWLSDTTAGVLLGVSAALLVPPVVEPVAERLGHLPLRKGQR